MSLHRICGIVFKQIVEKYFDDQFGNLMNSIIISKNFSIHCMVKFSSSTAFMNGLFPMYSSFSPIIQFQSQLHPVFSKSGGMKLIFGFIFLRIEKNLKIVQCSSFNIVTYDIDLYGSEWTHKLNNLLICRTDKIAHLLQHFSNLFYLPKPS